MALVGQSFIADFLAIVGTFLTMLFGLAGLRLLPIQLELVLGEILASISRYFTASQYQLRHAEDPIRIDPINWYGRGNVLYQIGQILTRFDLSRQREKSAKSFARLNKLISR